jgi:hypothetical protein
MSEQHLHWSRVHTMRDMRTSEIFLALRQPGDAGTYLPSRRRSSLLLVFAGLAVAVVVFYFVWFV